MLHRSEGSDDRLIEGGSWNSIPDELWVEIFSFQCTTFRSVLIDIPSISKRFYDLISPPNLEHLMKAFHKIHQEPSLKSTTRSESGWRKLFNFGKKKSNNEVANVGTESHEEDNLQEVIKQLEAEFKEMSMVDVNTEGDLLYKKLLELQDMTDFKDTVSKHGSYRSAFIQSVMDGIKLNPEKCFRKEMIYHASHIFRTEEDYLERLLENGEIDLEKCESENCGTTIVMTMDYSSSSAGVNIVANPIFYDTGVKFYEFRVHKSGKYDNFLMGICLTEVLDLDCMLKKTYQQTDNLSSRFLLEEPNIYDVKFSDFFGSSHSVGWAYYNEGGTCYSGGGSNNTVAKFSETLAYPCDSKGCEFVLGVYFDTKNMRLAFAKNGLLSTNGYDLKKLFTEKHSKFFDKKLALYPCLSMGHKFDAVTYESRIPLTTMVTIKSLINSVQFN